MTVSGMRDAAARFCDGLAAVDELQTYVDSCGLTGYRLREAYGGEDGLDLRALDADAASLGAAVDRAEEGARLARTQAAALLDGWHGAGGEQAARFLARHADAADRLVSAVRAAAHGCAALSEDLWRVLDARVARTESVAGTAEKGWLDAARSALAGSPDSGGAAIVESRVKPFVHNVILGDWITAMRQADDAARAAYHRAMVALDGAGPVSFGTPGPMAPMAAPPTAPCASAYPDTWAVAGSVPAAAPVQNSAPVPSPAGAPPDVASGPVPVTAWGPPDGTGVSPPGPALGSLPPASLPGADGVSGLGTFGRHGADGGWPGGVGEFGGADGPGTPEPGSADSHRSAQDAGRAADQGSAEDPGDAAASDSAESSGDAAEADESGSSDSSDDSDSADDSENPVGSGDSGEDGGPTQSGASEEPTAPPDPGPPPPVVPVPAAEPASTPCEIAADELPQVGG